MTAEELSQLRAMPTSKIRRNYWLCDEQLKLCTSPRHDQAARKLHLWQLDYLDELVRRGQQV